MISRTARWTLLLLSLLWNAPPPAGAQTETRITLDGTLGPAGSPTPIPDASGDVYTVDEAVGSTSGANLFHSFGRLDLASDDTLRFTASSGSPFRNVIARVTGGRSLIDGTLASTIPGANLFLVNPAGMIFGESARLDVRGSFFASSADALRFSDGAWLETRGTSPALLSPVDIDAFGFFDGTIGAIDVAGALEVSEGQAIGLFGGDLTLDGGVVSSLGGRVALASVASAGTIELGPLTAIDPQLVGFSQRGDIRIVGESVVSSSALSPLLPFVVDGDGNGAVDIRGLVDVLNIVVDADAELQLPPGSTVLFDQPIGDGSTRRVRYLRPDPDLLARGAGRLFAQAHDLVIEDSDLRATTLGGASGSLEIDLTGDLEIRRVASQADVGILARTGAEIAPGLLRLGSPGCDGAAVACRVVAPGVVDLEGLRLDLTNGEARGGNIEISAQNVRLIDGGRIATSSLSGGSPGEISIEAAGEVSITDAPGTDPDRGSALFSNHQGTPADPTAQAGGAIRVTAETLSLNGSGGIFAQTTGDGDAGNIEIDVGTLRVEGVSQIDSSTSGQSLTGTDPDETTTGRAGNIAVRARDLVVLRGDPEADDPARLSTFSQRRSAGSAGSISVSAPLLRIEDGAAIAVTTQGEGGGGDIDLDVGRLEMRRGARISASSESSTLPAGDIEIRSSGASELRSGSQVTANTGTGDGGNIRIASADVLLLGDETRVSADAEALGGSGGRVSIQAPLTLRSPTSQVSAVAPGGPEFQGEVVIDSPVVDLESQARPPEIEPVDASSLLMERCAARRTGDRAGSFQVAQWTGIPPSQDGPLLALDTIASRPPDVAAATDGATSIAASLLAAGSALRDGKLEEALTHYEAGAERGGQDAGRGALLVDALRGVGMTRQLRGEYHASLEPLERALSLARESGDLQREASALGQLGNAQLAIGEPDRARELLERAVETARRADDAKTLALATSHLGNLESVEGRLVDAKHHYAESAALSHQAGDPLRKAQALANAARIALAGNALAEAGATLVEAHALANELDRSVESLALDVHLAESYVALSRRDSAVRRGALQSAHRLLIAASGRAGRLGEPRLRSRVLGALGALYAEEGGRDREARYLTRRALLAAEQAGGPDLRARWHHQAGRIALATGDRNGAIAEFRRALAILEQLRPEVRARYGGAEIAFENSVEPTYLALVAALLDDIDIDTVPERQQERLSDAVDTINRWRAAELRDYFRDECIAALESQKRPVSRLSRRAAVVYPVLLADRVALLVETESGLSHYSVPVGREAVRARIAEFRRKILQRASFGFIPPARDLFDWLVAPYAAQLEEAAIETLVFVPDETLHSIPFGALHDGDRYLVERFSLGVTPNVEIISPRRVQPTQTRVLLAGVSEPVQGFPGLDNVPGELRSLEAMYGGELLLDAGFDAERLETELRERPPGVLHIASHAQFSGDPRSSFVLTHDGKLSMEDFSRLIAAGRFGDEPLELLFLSACETASGDRRSALGLAGVAVRAGARSAIGSLWTVNDAATSELVVHFYEELGKQETSRARALARVQRDMLARKRFQHPFYWAGFVVVNNWL